MLTGPNTANKHFERAEFEKLEQHCQEKLNKYPNHLNAIWWLARAKLEIGEASEAKTLFERILELEPSWKETHIEPYISKLPNE
ncbi:MAG: tetratricopeptide repeat protein [Candidatus Thiodiazotropha sp.]